ncbi:endo alpha-1,4 polygalactosaminidase [Alicyclobacillus cycloheptanicus]|uniref:Glycoside-hydrolase family GH114 TIM-barrel domain-containing protein n=1 Tax=Alicyclobacillus cycloheptanicus TaxID=1457 RepID=A0ABT9XK08_9BACL|nr:endo alpha-1,4 polygalactosaminidase [Alicyclobacillus cycloheptanicus]MDQ0190113.1 hypothetical protein [Alicyclobacillus cycloheptanicus]WDM02085.1 endo alpha-1,4 polygalactosaminidase [Alicyclobacillus cycloheptanicus]
MPARDIFQRIKSFMVYYGRPEAVRLEHADAFIVEPSAQTPASVEALKDTGSIVIGYTSVMEAGPHQLFYHQLEESDFLHDASGERITKPEYGNYVLDMTSSHWRGMLLYEIGRLLTEHRYDGVFLDTIGNVELQRLPDQPRQIQAAAEFVSQLRKWFPSAVLIQNNGLELLAAKTVPYLDGLVWENPPLTRRQSAEWVQLVARRLQQFTQEHPLKVLILFDGVEHMTRQEWIIGRSFADQHGFIPSFSPRHYLGAAVEEI